LALVEYDHSVTDIHYRTHVVFDDEKCDASIADLPKVFEQLVSFRGRESGHHLVDEQYVGVHRDHAPQFHDLLSADG
jgi:hypothetical protein